MIKLPVEHLVERLTRAHKNLSIDIGDIAAWAYEAMEDTSPYESLEEQMGVPIPVVDGKANLPLNIFRLLSVKSGCGPCDETCYKRASRCLIFPLNTNGTAYVDMLLFPSDDRGYPLIDDSLMETCYYYCLKMLMWDSYLHGHVGEQAWERIENGYHRASGKARADLRNMTTDKMRRINRLIRSSVIGSRFKLK